MTKPQLLTPENIAKVKESIKPLMRNFLRVEPKNTLVVPETQEGGSIINQAFSKLESLGYSQEDSQLLISEVVEALYNEKNKNA